MSIFKLLKIWAVRHNIWILANERGGKDGGSVPQQREPTPEETALTQAMTGIYAPMGQYYAGTLPAQGEAARYQIALQTGQGLGNWWETPPTEPTETTTTSTSKSGHPLQSMLDWISGSSGTTSREQDEYQQALDAYNNGGTLTDPSTWQYGLQESGGLMGLGAQQQAGQLGTQIALEPYRQQLGSEILQNQELAGGAGSAYNMSPMMQQAGDIYAQQLQNRGLYDTTNLFPQLYAKQAANIGAQYEQQRRAEQLGLLGLLQ